MIRVFPVKTNWTPEDEFVFFGDPPMYLDGLDLSMPVRISVVFTWHIEEGKRLLRAWSKDFTDVQLGGPAFGDPGGEFVPGRFLKRGCTITSRGCTKNCGWCGVPGFEGNKIRELFINPGWIVQDNNLLACQPEHIAKVFDMLRQQDRAIFFNGGLDKHYLTEWHRSLFDSIKIGELWFACDTSFDVPALERAAQLLAGIPLRKRRCYTMIGYGGETLSDAEARIEKVFNLDFMPFCQLYQPVTGPRIFYSKPWLQLRRKWARPAAYMPRKDSINPAQSC